MTEQLQYRAYSDPDLISTPVQPTLWGEVPKPRVDDLGYLYALWVFDCWIKLGFSVEPLERAKRLRGILIGTTHFGATKGDEARMHRRYRPWHIAHEYYHPGPGVIACAQAMPVCYHSLPILRLAA